MGTNFGSRAVIDGMVCCLDASSKQTYNRAYVDASEWTADGGGNALPISNWVTSSGSETFFGQNGDGNSRILDTDPWGRRAKVWDVSNQDSASNADGGWNSSNFPINNQKMYRWTTWVRRKNTGNGSFYMGCYGKNSGGTNVGVLGRDNGTNYTNPYFKSSGWWGSANDWYLVIGHVWPANSGTGDNHPNSGVWDINGNKVANPNRDYTWRTDCTQSIHRTYLYYSTNTSTNQQWFEPSVECVDGTERPFNELFYKPMSGYKDLSGNNNHFQPGDYGALFNVDGTPTFPTGGRRFNGPPSNQFDITATNGYTIFLAMRTNAGNSNSAFKFYTGTTNNSTTRGIFLHPGWSNQTMYFDQAGCCNADQRTQVTIGSPMTSMQIYTLRSTYQTRNIFLNGVSQVQNNTTAATFTLSSKNADLGSSEEYGGDSSNWNGNLAYFSVYNRGLTDDEIKTQTQMLKGRFGIA
jgi:hypothetical protein